METKAQGVKKYITGFKPFDGFLGFNLNLCCPSKNIVKFGRGGAMVRRTIKTNKLIKIITKENYPVSIKLSLGLNAVQKASKVYLDCLKETDVDFYVVQAKTSAQKSTEEYDYSVFSECVDTGKEIIANGGIDSQKKVNNIKKIGCKGVMVGRSALLNPAIFNQFKSKKVKSINELKDEYNKLCKLYFEKEKYYSNFLKVQKSGKFD